MTNSKPPAAAGAQKDHSRSDQKSLTRAHRPCFPSALSVPSLSTLSLNTYSALRTLGTQLKTRQMHLCILGSLLSRDRQLNYKCTPQKKITETCEQEKEKNKAQGDPKGPSSGGRTCTLRNSKHESFWKELSVCSSEGWSLWPEGKSKRETVG